MYWGVSPARSISLTYARLAKGMTGFWDETNSVFTSDNWSSNVATDGRFHRYCVVNIFLKNRGSREEFVLQFNVSREQATIRLIPLSDNNPVRSRGGSREPYWDGQFKICLRIFVVLTSSSSGVLLECFHIIAVVIDSNNIGTVGYRGTVYLILIPHQHNIFFKNGYKV